jgi:hypothetical protein
MAVIDGEKSSPVFSSASAPVVSLLTGEALESSGGGGSSITYRMRAYDTTLAQVVFWNSSVIDDTGVNYLGPGPLTMVVVSGIIPPP